MKIIKTQLRRLIRKELVEMSKIEHADPIATILDGADVQRVLKSLSRDVAVNIAVRREDIAHYDNIIFTALDDALLEILESIYDPDRGPDHDEPL